MRWIAPKSEKKLPGYLCSDRSCVRRRGDLVDLLVADAIVARMSRPDAVALTSRHNGDRVAEALKTAQALQQRLDGFIDQASDGRLTPAALARIEAKLLPQIEGAQATARAHVVDHPLVASLAGPHARAQWEAFTVKDRRTVVTSLLDVTINRSTAAHRGFNPKDIALVWRTPGR